MCGKRAVRFPAQRGLFEKVKQRFMKHRLTVMSRQGHSAGVREKSRSLGFRRGETCLEY